MRTVLRKGVFETNSSSVHSICIAKDSCTDQEYPEKLYFKHGEFGWEYECYRTPEEKASYLYEAVCGIYENRADRENIKNQLFDILGKKGIIAEFEEDKEDEYGFREGYIDHCWEVKEWLDSVLHSEKRLMNFLFSDKSYVHTGNDNSRYHTIHAEYPHEEYYKEN